MTSLWTELSPTFLRFEQNIALSEPGGRRLTYGQVSSQIELFTSLVKSYSDAGKERVGLLAPKSIDGVLAIMGSLKLGYPYVPLDFGSPPDRLSAIIEDAALTILIAHKELEAEKAESLRQLSFEQVDEFGDLTIWKRPYRELDIPDDIAYILFTSGSTGRPKGVLISHTNALSFVNWCITEFSVTDRDILSSIAPFHFDLSIFDLFAGLISGAEIVLFNQKMIKNPRFLTSAFRDSAITIAYTTPTVLQLMMGFGKWERFIYSDLRLILFAGEVFSKQSWQRLSSIWPSVDMYNLYGPTETNVVTYYKVDARADAKDEGPFPIGWSCPYAHCHIGDIDKTESQEEGILFVKGDSVAHGYLPKNSRQNEAFIISGDDVWYNTGDVVRRRPDNMLEFLGRADRMVKRSGYRIELGELEAAAEDLMDIRQAVAIDVKKGGVLKIILFIVNTDEHSEPTISELLKQLRSKLPDYMLPDETHFIGSIPMTSNHKVDYSKLKKIAENG